MAYFGVISVMHTIIRLLNSSQIWIVSSSLELISSVYDEVESLKQVLKRLDNYSSSSRNRMNELDTQIREVVFKLEDVIESHLSNLFLPQSEEITRDEICSIKILSIDDKEIIQSLVETLKKMKEEYDYELDKLPLPEEEEEYNQAVSLSSDFEGTKPNILGFYEDELIRIKNELMKSKSYEFQIVSVVVERRTTCTIFAKLLYEQAKTGSFDGCALVIVGPKYQVKDILLDKEESWCFLREKMFGGKICPRELEKAGKTIAENCEGLPLMIDTVASFLSEAENSLENWAEAAKKENLVFKKAYDKISEMLYPSYDYLPQFMKAFFLYMGVFPKKHKIPTSKLLKLWNCEGIIELDVWNFEKHSKYCLTEFVSRSLLLEGKTTSSSCGIKTSSLHSVYWHLCIREARKNKFFHVLNRYSDAFDECIKGQRRLCIQNNVLFALKDVNDSVASISTAPSLLCTGPAHPYPVPICLGFCLLKVLDALTLRFYDFPIKVVHLVLLRYLGLTYDGKIPPSISNLRNLEYLIVHRNNHTKSIGAPSYLPNEIWGMVQLVHLHVMGSDLPNPCGAVLPNLVSLVDISAQSVMEGVLRGTPYLKKLGIQIELTPDASQPMFSFNDFDLSHLDRLTSLKCAVVNPELTWSGMVASPPLISSLPSSHGKLSLSGFGYPWEYMTTIARLPNLRVLKLRCYAFRG